jgi:hypothetical protein
MARVEIQAVEAGFALTREGEVLVQLTPDDVLGLANVAANLRQVAMARLNLPAGAVFVTPVSDAAATWDAMGEKILIRLGDTQSGHTVFELEHSLAEFLSQEILCLVRPAFPSRQ